MISVLIPVFNYDVTSLVTNVHTQLQICNITYEIICLDDGSCAETLEQNDRISNLEFTKYLKSNINLGRTRVRQNLAEIAIYDWLLFLDADVMPVSERFINNYIAYFKLGFDCIYGGIAYEQIIPPDDKLLRYTYGKRYEQLTARRRNKRPFKITVSANQMITRSLFLDVNSYVLQKNYGSDTIFGAQLMQQNAVILHIDNAVYHLGIEASAIYLKKTEQAVETLLSLFKNENFKNQQNDLLNLFIKLKQFRGHYFFSLIFKLFGKPIRKNLLSKNPSIRFFQLYKISYLCYKDLNPN